MHQRSLFITSGHAAPCTSGARAAAPTVTVMSAGAEYKIDCLVISRAEAGDWGAGECLARTGSSAISGIGRSSVLTAVLLTFASGSPPTAVATALQEAVAN